jgi:hypothetical protein
MKVPRPCPLVLLVKVGWRRGKTFGCEEGTDERWNREKLSRVPPHSVRTLNLHIKPRNKWKAHPQRMEHTRIPLQAYKYQPSGKRDIDRPRRRWRETILDVGTGDSPNPWSDDDLGRGYNWVTMSPGVINTEAWSSRLGVGRDADNLTPQNSRC